MIFGAISQNKQLKQAALHAKDTSHRLEKASSYSAKVSSSKNYAKNIDDDSQIKFSTGSNSKTKGSMEGYAYQKSAVIQPNNYGYSNKSLQTARYKDRSFDRSSTYEGLPIVNLNTNANNAKIMNYSSSTMEGSSSHRLNAIVRNNMQFK